MKFLSVKENQVVVQGFPVLCDFQDQKPFCAHHAFSTYNAQHVCGIHRTLDAHSVSQVSSRLEDGSIGNARRLGHEPLQFQVRQVGKHEDRPSQPAREQVQSPQQGEDVQQGQHRHQAQQNQQGRQSPAPPPEGHSQPGPNPWQKGKTLREVTQQGQHSQQGEDSGCQARHAQQGENSFPAKAEWEEEL